MRMRLTCQEYLCPWWQVVTTLRVTPDARPHLSRPSHVRKYVGGYPSTAAFLPNVCADDRTVRAFGLLPTLRAPVRQRSAAGGSADVGPGLTPPPDGRHEGQVVSPSQDDFGGGERQHILIFRNVSTRYLVILIETILGLVILPFNVRHLGPATYGLWMLTASVTVHFSVLDLGYGGAIVKFIAQYRARRDRRALNEIASTMFIVFGAAGLVAYAVAMGIAFNLGALFRITRSKRRSASGSS